MAEAETKLQAAKLEAASIAQAHAQQATIEAGSTDTAPQVQSSALTAQAVREFFQSLPPTVAQHPEGIGAVKQVMGLLEMLDSAAKIENAKGDTKQDTTAQASQSCEPADMQLDDDLLDQMAKAATAPASEGEEAVQERKLRVAEAKERLRAKRTDLEVGIAKVRKISKK